MLIIKFISDPDFTACLYTMRTISLLCTQLPPGYIDNNKRCRGQSNHTGQEWVVIARRVLSQAGKLGFQVYYIGFFAKYFSHSDCSTIPAVLFFCFFTLNSLI